MASLYQLREIELVEDLAMRLAPFIAAYRPFQELPTPKELRDAGYEKVEDESFTEELRECYFESKGYYPEEDLEIQKT